ncbi:DUF732 domain-containing protein [Streptomyces noursei]|uniref:DUF732 domain-containing protein n=1 Tax=Streptomyces noursei TaxID=1971 RepID=UPI001673D7E3|nr:DUF732 domain-containing protein [Streptomyces noursei]MCZ1013642.1 DUF732 domain-containing protein [Streptomyces noursei]GGX25213.1 hypothetical protein GCM10010341_53030 [Streptomyces noursei]
MKRTAIALTTLALAGVLAACGSSDGVKVEDAKPPVLSTPAATASPDKVIQDVERDRGIPPKPDAATRAKYIRALEAISPAIVNGKEDRAVSRGRDTCGTVHSFPKDHAKQVDMTRQRFSGAKEFTAAQAEQILAAVRTHLCPKK